MPAGTSTFIAFQLVETTPSTQTIVQEGKERKGFHLSPGTTAMSLEVPESTCGTFYFNSTAERTIRMEYEQDISSASVASYVIADRSGAIGQRDIRMTVRPSTMNIARPVLIEPKKSDVLLLMQLSVVHLQLRHGTSQTFLMKVMT